MCKSENETGELLGMSAGEERSALAGGGWTNLTWLFVPGAVVVVVVQDLSSSAVKLFGILSMEKT